MNSEPNQIQAPAAYEPKTPPNYGPVGREPQETLQNRRRQPLDQKLPFEIISASSTALKAEPGTIDDDAHPETVQAFGSPPSDGTWYLEAKVVINADTGAITSTAAQWVNTESTDTTTNFFYTMGQVLIATAGGIQSFTVSQYNYGPIYVLIHGTYDAKWGATMF